MAVPRLPTVGGSLARAVLWLFLAAVLYATAEKVKTVELVVYSEGAIHQEAVADDDPVYLEEIRQARRKALPYYGGSVIFGLAGIGFVRRAIRLQRKTKRRVPLAASGR